MKSSEQTNEISAALAKAQGTINNPGKTAINPHFKSQYADLSSGINAIREGLSSNGIAFVQATRVEGDVVMLDTRLTHSGGQWIESEWPVTKLPAQPQVIGSALTYARRYSLFSLVGIAGEDDDGTAASKAEIHAPPPTAFISPEQVEELDTLLVELGDEFTEGFKKYFKIQFLGRLPEDEFVAAKKIIAAKKKKLDAAEKAQVTPPRSANGWDGDQLEKAEAEAAKRKAQMSEATP